MKDINYIGFAGSMGSGKDTFADLLKEHDYIQEVHAFASGVKACGEIFFDLPRDERTFESRVIWQGIGRGFREIHEKVYGNPNIWIKYLFKRMKNRMEHSVPNTTFAITDVRYPDEALEILINGGIIVYLVANGQMRKERIEQRDNITISNEKWEEINNDYSEEFTKMHNFWEFFIGEHEHFLLENRVIELNQLTNDTQENFEILKKQLKLNGFHR